MRILVTGSAGFIGSHLTDALLAAGHEVVGIDNLTTGRQENFPISASPPSQLYIGDITDYDDMKAIGSAGSFDVIYHCAASYQDREAWEADALTNVLGTINVVREAQRSKAKLIYFQTSLCYGTRPISPVQIGAALDPHGSYAVSKTAGECFIRDSGVEFVSFRLANIYGPRNISGPPPTFFMRLSQGLPCTVVDSRRDFVYVDDLIDVAVQALDHGSGFYHIASGADYSIAEVFEAIRAAMGIEVLPPVVTPRGPDDAETLLLNPRETIREFGAVGKVPLAEGMRRAVEWYQAHPPTTTYTHLAANKG